MSAKLFIFAVVALQLGAAACYAYKRQWAQAVMLVGAAIANAAVAFIK
jgi:hypothetical protein